MSNLQQMPRSARTGSSTRDGTMARCSFWANVVALLVLPMAMGSAVEAPAAQPTVVRVLGIPNHDAMLSASRAAGFAASRYGPAGRPAEGYQVVSIGEDVPAQDAIRVLEIAVETIPTMKFVVLRGDRTNAAGEKNEIVLGGTNAIMDQFPAGRGLSDAEIRDLVSAGKQRRDLFYSRIRESYMPKAAGSGARVNIRDDGNLEFTADDGKRMIVDQDGRRGAVLSDGTVVFTQANLMGLRPVRERDSPSGAWIDELNQWLDWVSDRMLRDIEILVDDPESFANYESLEARCCSDGYQKLHNRRKYLTQLIDMKFARGNDDNGP